MYVKSRLLVCIYSVFFHRMIQSIQICLERSQVQDMGAENIHIYTTSYRLVNQFNMKSAVVFTKNYHDYKCDFFLQQFNKQEVN